MDISCLRVFDNVVKCNKYKQDIEWTVIAGILLEYPSTNTFKCISLAGGTKCIPECKKQMDGSLIHDCHAEVLARRSALKYLYHHCQLAIFGNSNLLSFTADSSIPFKFIQKCRFHLYISQAPCTYSNKTDYPCLISVGGDASTTALDHDIIGDESYRGSTSTSTTLNNTQDDLVLRGRIDFSQLNRLRTKPGRLNSLPSDSMSCSDKICKWNTIGFQGALLSKLLGVLYFDSVTIGNYFDYAALDGSLNGRVSDFLNGRRLGLKILKATEKFPLEKSDTNHLVSNIVFNWIDGLDIETIVNGRREGACKDKKSGKYPKKTFSRISKSILFDDFKRVSGAHYDMRNHSTYRDMKDSALEYQKEKLKFLRHSNFINWIKTDRDFEKFY